MRRERLAAQQAERARLVQEKQQYNKQRIEGTLAEREQQVSIAFVLIYVSHFMLKVPGVLCVDSISSGALKSLELLELTVTPSRTEAILSDCIETLAPDNKAALAMVLGHLYKVTPAVLFQTIFFTWH